VVSGSDDQTTRIWDLTEGSVEVIEVLARVRAVVLAQPQSIVIGTEMSLMVVDLAERQK
jgi:hypothetical protein